MMDMFSGQSPFLLLSLGLLLVQLLHGALGILTITNTISNSRPRLGETITLKCNIVGGTPISVIWFKDRHHTTEVVYLAYNCLVSSNEYKSRLTNVQCDANNFNFQLTNVQISDRGDWECEADGEEATSSLKVDVLVPPLTPTVTNPPPVKVGDTAKFTCNAENESVTKPVTYTWTKNGNSLSKGTAELGALLFSSVKKTDAGNYVCVAKNNAGSKSSTAQELVVHYAPDSVQLKTTTSSNSKSESETETFTCEAIGGNPVPSLKLIRQEGTTKQTLIQENNRVVIFRRQMMRQDNQVKFYCEATGPGIPNYMMSAVIIYNVLFPHTVQVKLSKTNVNEHEFVRFECATSGGNPELITRYQWLWKKSGSTTEQIIQDTDTSTQNGKFLEFARIPYDKSGTYSCKAWNQGGMGQASTVLNVQYSPRIDPEAKMKYDVAGQIGMKASFQLFIIANPTPVTTGYVWSKDGNILSDTSPDYEISSEPKSSKLIIKNVKSSDYKNYTCSVKTSGFQAKVFNFKLLKAGPPSAPKELRVVNTTAIAATLQWISEFPGGSEQKFYVQYKKSADTWDDASEVPQGGITDPGLKKVVYHKVMKLDSDVWYVFRVRSKNSYPGPHTSDFSNIASKKTPAAPQTTIKGVSRTKNQVTLRWKKVTGKYTVIKIKYCQTGTEDCKDYIVPKQNDDYAIFFVEDDETYYYYMIVEDDGDVVYKSKPLVHDDNANAGSVQNSKIGLIAGIVGAAVVLILIAIIVVAIILRKRKPSSNKKKREAQELQNNVVNDQLVPSGQVNHAMYRTPTRSECDPNENRNSYPNSVIGSQQNLTPLHVNLQKPDVVSHTQKSMESPYQNVPVGQKGSRPPSVASRPSRPGSRAEENPYQNVNVNRNGQPQRYSGGGGLPQPIGVDGTVYSELSFHGARNPAHPQYNYPIRRTEESAPYAVVDFSRKAPPVNMEYTV